MDSFRVAEETVPMQIDIPISIANSAEPGLLPWAHPRDQVSNRAPVDTSNASTGSRSSPCGRGPTIVVYHNLSATEHPLTRGLGVTTDPDVFRRHIKYFAKNFDLIGPSDLLGGRSPKKPLLITFDDVYRSVLDIAGPTLREVGAASIWFLNPASIVEDALPMDNLLAFAVGCAGGAELLAGLGLHHQAGRPVSSLISKDLPKLSNIAIGQISAAVAEHFGTTESELRRESALFLNARDLCQLDAYGIEAGNHSMNHRFLRSLSDPDLQVEISASRQLLEQLVGHPVRYFAVPYGNELDATDRALEVARSSGHLATFLVHARCNDRRRVEDVFYRIGPENVRPQFLPIVLDVLPRLRTVWNSLH